MKFSAPDRNFQQTVPLSSCFSCSLKGGKIVPGKHKSLIFSLMLVRDTICGSFSKFLQLPLSDSHCEISYDLQANVEEIFLSFSSVLKVTTLDCKIIQKCRCGGSRSCPLI